MFNADEYYEDESWDWFPELDPHPMRTNTTLDCLDVMDIMAGVVLGAERQVDEGNAKHPGKEFYYTSYKRYKTIVENVQGGGS